MADADEKLSTYLDRLIDVAWTGPMDYNRRRKVIQRTTAVSIRYYIEDDVTGRPVPIDDSADHFLLTKFHALREEFLDRPLPVYEEPKPISGEIPWRNMHVETCPTCDRSTDDGAITCSNPCHLNVITHMMADQPGVYRPEITRTLPLKDEDGDL
jgi:hypothetical protein